LSGLEKSVIKERKNDAQLSITSYYHPAARLAIIVAITICASAFLGLASQTFPLGDDLAAPLRSPLNEFQPQELPVGLAASVGWTYQHWSGRWAGVGLETILLPKVPERYPWLLVFLALAQAGLPYAAHRLLGLQPAVAAVVSNNNVGVVSDLGSGRASEWHAQLRQRFQLLRSSNRASDVQLPPLTVSSANLKPGNITSDPNHWSNQCMSAYFGVHSVRTVTRTADNRLEEESQKTGGIE
jgi:hypothetical protein